MPRSWTVLEPRTHGRRAHRRRPDRRGWRARAQDRRTRRGCQGADARARLHRRAQPPRGRPVRDAGRRACREPGRDDDHRRPGRVRDLSHPGTLRADGKDAAGDQRRGLRRPRQHPQRSHGQGRFPAPCDAGRNREDAQARGGGDAGRRARAFHRPRVRPGHLLGARRDRRAREGGEALQRALHQPHPQRRPLFLEGDRRDRQHRPRSEDPGRGHAHEARHEGLVGPVRKAARRAERGAGGGHRRHGRRLPV